MKNLFSALRLLLIMTVLTGIVYPLIITGIGQIVFSRQANGSIITVDGKIIGSELVGQKFVSNRYFWSRPSAIDYNPMPSGATNFGPTSAALRDAVQERREQFRNLGGSAVPADMLFASASGIDPHISLEAARLQINRIANARGFRAKQKEKIAELVEGFIERPQVSIFGEPRVNVLLLNVALDQVK
jgi:potassium-transporting ATPase KdpC subunit